MRSVSDAIGFSLPDEVSAVVEGELGFVEAYHTIRAISVADGTNEILARTIFQRLLGGDLDL